MEEDPRGHCAGARPVKRSGVGVHDELGTLVRDTTGEDALCVPPVQTAPTP